MKSFKFESSKKRVHLQSEAEEPGHRDDERGRIMKAESGELNPSLFCPSKKRKKKRKKEIETRIYCELLQFESMRVWRSGNTVKNPKTSMKPELWPLH